MSEERKPTWSLPYSTPAPPPEKRRAVTHLRRGIYIALAVVLVVVVVQFQHGTRKYQRRWEKFVAENPESLQQTDPNLRPPKKVKGMEHIDYVRGTVDIFDLETQRWSPLSERFTRRT